MMTRALLKLDVLKEKQGQLLDSFQTLSQQTLFRTKNGKSNMQRDMFTFKV